MKGKTCIVSNMKVDDWDSTPSINCTNCHDDLVEDVLTFCDLCTFYPGLEVDKYRKSGYSWSL